jgi:hypothetical protein
VEGPILILFYRRVTAYKRAERYRVPARLFSRRRSIAPVAAGERRTLYYYALCFPKKDLLSAAVYPRGKSFIIKIQNLSKKIPK